MIGVSCESESSLLFMRGVTRNSYSPKVLGLGSLHGKLHDQGSFTRFPAFTLREIQYEASPKQNNEIIQLLVDFKAANQVRDFDAVVIDASSFRSPNPFGSLIINEVFKSKFILLRALDVYPNADLYRRIIASPLFAVVADNLTSKDGFAIFRRL